MDSLKLENNIHIRRIARGEIASLLVFIKKMGFTERSQDSWVGENMDAVVALKDDVIIGAIPFSKRDWKR